MCGVKLLNDIYIADSKYRLVSYELDCRLVEMVAKLDFSPLNNSVFVFSVFEVFVEVGNVTDDWVGNTKTIHSIFLSRVVKVDYIHANEPLVEKIGQQQVPKAVTQSCAQKTYDSGVH